VKKNSRAKSLQGSISDQNQSSTQLGLHAGGKAKVGYMELISEEE